MSFYVYVRGMIVFTFNLDYMLYSYYHYINCRKKVHFEWRSCKYFSFGAIINMCGTHFIEQKAVKPVSMKWRKIYLYKIKIKVYICV